MNSMDKILRIANGAKPMNTTMSSADRIMQYAAPQAEPQPQDNSTWGRFKNFAGSNAGRTLWGGLGAGLGVALTGGNLQDALGYGVIGAGNTVDTLNQNRQYANRLALKQQERADALAKEQRDNQFRLGLQDRALAQSKQLADHQLENTLARLRGEQEIKDTAEQAAKQRKIAAINSNPYLTEDQKQWQIAGLDGLNFDRGAYYTDTLLRDPNNSEALDYFNNQRQLQNMLKSPTERLAEAAGIAKDGGLALDPESLNKGEISYITKPQSLSGEMQAFKEMVQRGVDPQTALIASGLNKLEYNVGLESVKAGLDRGTHAANAETDYDYQTKGAYRDADIKQQQTLLEDKVRRGFEVFSKTLPADIIIEANQTAQILQKQGYNVTVSDILFNDYKKGVLANANTAAGINKTVADTKKINRELSHPYLSPVEEARQKERAKQEEKLKFKQQEQDMADVRDFYSSVSEFPVLQKQMDDLKNTAEMATGSGFGRMVDATGAFFGETTDGAENAAKFESQALNVVLPQLKKIFGGNISDGEREALVKLIGEKDSTAREKQARINAFVANKAALMAQKAADLADRKLIPADVAKAQISFYEGLINPKANEASADTVVDYKNKYNLE